MRIGKNILNSLSKELTFDYENDRYKLITTLFNIMKNWKS